MPAHPHPEVRGLLALVDLEAAARRAQSLDELYFTIANETVRLVPYAQAVLLSVAPSGRSRSRVEAVSSIAVVDRGTPLVRWLEAVVDTLVGAHEGAAPQAQRVARSEVGAELGSSWEEFAISNAALCPLTLADGRRMGALWLTRSSPWSDQDLVLLQHVAETFAHAWSALVGRRRAARRSWPRALVFALVVALIAGALTVRVPLSVLAPARVVATRPAVLSAPIDGVIATVHVPPNSLVTEGQAVFTFEGTSLRHRYDVAEKALAVAIAAYRTASQGAFADPRRKASVQLLKAEVDLAQAELEFASDLLAQMSVTAPRAGLLLYSSEEDWVGRPVVVGERIMVIADPNSIEVRVDLAVDDAIVLREGARAEVFLDVDPLTALDAVVERFSYDATVIETGSLAYDVRARFDPTPDSVQIGYQGTAKVYGDPVMLGFLLFRRPLAALRQRFGL